LQDHAMDDFIASVKSTNVDLGFLNLECSCQMMYQAYHYG
jgi:hypothetical protein